MRRARRRRLAAPMLVLLAALPAPGRAADPAARACAQAAAAEREAAELQRNAERRARFLAGTPAGRGDGPAPAAASAADASLRAALAEARDLLPKLREAAVAARHDRGSVPGLGDWFDRMAQELAQAVQGAEACAAAPGRCAPPALACPAPPPQPAIRGVASADFIRQVQQAYAQHAARVRQACQALGTALRQAAQRDAPVVRAAAREGAAGPVPGTELYWVRIRALQAEATRHRQEADRLAGAAGACGARGPTPGGGARATPPPRSVDLAAAWARPRSTGARLAAPAAPLPRLGSGAGPALAGRTPAPEDGEPAPSRWDALAAAGAAARDAAKERAREFWRGELAAWEEANQQVELTEFVKGRPRALVEDVASSLLEGVPGGRAVTAGYKILSAVKETTSEVSQIVTAAPEVIVHGDEAATAELAARAERVPLHFMLNLFDDQVGKIPRPKWRAREAPGE